MFDLSSLKTGPLRRLRTRRGDFLTLASDGGVGALMAYYGEYAEHEIVLLEALTAAGDTVIDVGANIGTHTVPLARQVGASGRLIAFEAQPVMAQLLEANLALNECLGVEVRVAAAGETTGYVNATAVDYTVAEQNFGGVSFIGGQPDARAPVQRLDDLETRPALIKIDVEGMELHVLKGAAAMIGDCRPVIYLESYPNPGWEQVLLWLREQGYGLFWDVQPLHNPANFNERTQPYFWNGLASNLLALPPGRVIDPGVFGLEEVRQIKEHKFNRALAALEHLRPT